MCLATEAFILTSLTIYGNTCMITEADRENTLTQETFLKHLKKKKKVMCITFHWIVLVIKERFFLFSGN